MWMVHEWGDFIATATTNVVTIPLVVNHYKVYVSRRDGTSSVIVGAQMNNSENFIMYFSANNGNKASWCLFNY